MEEEGNLYSRVQGAFTFCKIVNVSDTDLRFSGLTSNISIDNLATYQEFVAVTLKYSILGANVRKYHKTYNSPVLPDRFKARCNEKQTYPYRWIIYYDKRHN